MYGCVDERFVVFIDCIIAASKKCCITQSPAKWLCGLCHRGVDIQGPMLDPAILQSKTGVWKEELASVVTDIACIAYPK